MFKSRQSLDQVTSPSLSLLSLDSASQITILFTKAPQVSAYNKAAVAAPQQQSLNHRHSRHFRENMNRLYVAIWSFTL